MFNYKTSDAFTFFKIKNTRKCKKCTLFDSIERTQRTLNSVQINFPKQAEVFLKKDVKLILQKSLELPFNQRQLQLYKLMTQEDHFTLPLQYLRESLFFKEEVFIKRMTRRLASRNKEYFLIHPKKVEVFLFNYFANHDFVFDFGHFSVFDLLFIVLILFKKKYKTWRSTGIDLNNLRKSQTSKRQDHLFKFYIKSLLTTLANDRQPLSKHNKSRKMVDLSQVCFDENFDFRKEIKNLFNENVTSKKDKVKRPKKEKLRLFIKKLAGNPTFSQLVNRHNINSITLRMFEEYKRTRLKMHLSSMIDKLTKTKYNPGGFFKLVRKQALNPKFKSIWSLSEFKAGRDIFVKFLDS